MDYQGLTIDFCKSVGANYLLRGVRNNGDFDFEKAIAGNGFFKIKIAIVTNSSKKIVGTYGFTKINGESLVIHHFDFGVI